MSVLGCAGSWHLAVGSCWLAMAQLLGNAPCIIPSFVDHIPIDYGQCIFSLVQTHILTRILGHTYLYIY
jgi:hypothetical protein